MPYYKVSSYLMVDFYNINLDVDVFGCNICASNYNKISCYLIMNFENRSNFFCFAVFLWCLF